MNKTKIDWATHTWNPVIGCLNSCPYCYARSTAKRWGMSFEPHWRERKFNCAMPKQPARIFVNSMSDVMYWKRQWWQRVLQRIREAPEHTFLFLAHNPIIYLHWMDKLPPNCWLGATATDKDGIELAQHHFPYLARDWVTFLSIEPILEGINPKMIDPREVQWVILAAETGNRPEKIIPPPEWIEPFLELKIPLFMKHNLPWSGPWRKEFPA